MPLTLRQKRFWGQSQGGKFKCPQCGGVVIERMSLEQGVTYNCTAKDCDWRKEVVWNDLAIVN